MKRYGYAAGALLGDTSAPCPCGHIMLCNVARTMRGPSGAERKHRVSESTTGGPTAKPRRGAVGPVRSPFSAGLGASVGFLLPNLPLGLFWFAALVVLILLGILLAVAWVVVMAVTLAVLWL